MDETIKASLLWGVVSALFFLVGLQAYVLLGGEFVAIEAVVALTAAVGVVSAGLAHLARPRLRRR